MTCVRVCVCVCVCALDNSHLLDSCVYRICQDCAWPICPVPEVGRKYQDIETPEAASDSPFLFLKIFIYLFGYVRILVAARGIFHCLVAL